MQNRIWICSGTDNNETYTKWLEVDPDNKKIYILTDTPREVFKRQEELEYLFIIIETLLEVYEFKNELSNIVRFLEEHGIYKEINDGKKS